MIRGLVAWGVLALVFVLAGCTGPAGAPGVAGSARAYGAIDMNGAVDPQRSKNINSVEHGSPGVYCVHFDPSVDIEHAVALVTADQWPRSAAATTCTSGNGRGVSVSTFSVPTGVRENASFYIMIP